jgi:acetyl-CoA acetyltransferase family protein
MSMKQREVVIVDGARTPIGKHGGYYNALSAEDLGVLAMEEAIRRSGIDLSKTKIDQVVAGMIYIDSRTQHIYLPRNVAMRVAEKFGDTDNLNVAPGKTTLRICGTGFQTLADAWDLITGVEQQQMDTVVSFATECMSRTNRIHQGRRLKDDVWNFTDAPATDSLLEGFNHYLFDVAMAGTAEDYGAQQGITLDDCITFSALSHERAMKAQAAQWNRFAEPNGHDHLRGSFAVDTVDEDGHTLNVWRDEGTRYDATYEELAKLRPLIKRDGLVTPGTASQISDGAASAVVMARDVADAQGIPYIAVLRGYHFDTVDPRVMSRGPVPAVHGLLEKLGLTLGEVDLFEVNEAFAAQYLAVEKELGLPRDLTNVNGGAIAIGHNIAATGLRITLDMIYELKRRNLKRGIASACIGGGQGGAVCVEIV